jgi:hypothetical protein
MIKQMHEQMWEKLDESLGVSTASQLPDVH